MLLSACTNMQGNVTETEVKEKPLSKAEIQEMIDSSVAKHLSSATNNISKNIECKNLFSQIMEEEVGDPSSETIFGPFYSPKKDSCVYGHAIYNIGGQEHSHRYLIEDAISGQYIWSRSVIDPAKWGETVDMFDEKIQELTGINYDE